MIQDIGITYPDRKYYFFQIAQTLMLIFTPFFPSALHLMLHLMLMDSHLQWTTNICKCLEHLLTTLT